MTLRELHNRFYMGIDKYPSASSPSFLRMEIDAFINDAIEYVIKSKVKGHNKRLAGFQGDQFISDDLRFLIRNASFSGFTETAEDNSFSVSLDDCKDYMYLVSEDVYISSDQKCWPKGDDGKPEVKRSDVIEATLENLDSKLSNSLSDHIYRLPSPKPIRVFAGNTVYLYTDGKYRIDRYQINYIPRPSKITWDSDNDKNNDEPMHWIFPEHVWSEVINVAVRSALENISDPRYQSYSINNSYNE